MSEDTPRPFQLMSYDTYSGWDEDYTYPTLEQALERAPEIVGRRPFVIINLDTNEQVAQGGNSPEDEDHSNWLQRCPF